MKKQVLVFLVILFIPFVMSATTVVVNQSPTPSPSPTSHWYSGITSFLSSPLFWGLLALGIGILLFIGLCAFIFSIIAKYIKLRSDIFYRMKKERIKLAKIQRRMASPHWWKVSKNPPVRIVKKVNGELFVSRPIGTYRGDYTTHEGNVCIAINFEGDKQYWFFPKTSLIIVPDRDTVEFIKKDKEGNVTKTIVENIPRAKDMIHFNEDEVLLFIESISYQSEFNFPVVKTLEGHIINLALPIFKTLKDVALGDFVYDQTTDFGNLAKKGMDINPHVRAIQRVGDLNQQADTSQQTQQ